MIMAIGIGKLFSLKISRFNLKWETEREEIYLGAQIHSPAKGTKDFDSKRGFPSPIIIIIHGIIGLQSQF
jgi:hypothetical protein